jgi:hypothetical protein
LLVRADSLFSVSSSSSSATGGDISTMCSMVAITAMC